MTTPEFLSAHQSRCAAAFEALLPSWHPAPSSTEPECPSCRRTDIAPSGWTDDRSRRRYRCRSCKRKFTEQPQGHVCRCEVPGQKPTCQQCPEFKQFMERVRREMDKIQTEDKVTRSEVHVVSIEPMD